MNKLNQNSDRIFCELEAAAATKSKVETPICEYVKPSRPFVKAAALASIYSYYVARAESARWNESF